MPEIRGKQNKKPNKKIQSNHTEIVSHYCLSFLFPVMLLINPLNREHAIRIALLIKTMVRMVGTHT